MRRKNPLAIVLIAAGAISLIFGWPWGSLVGAILILAGVIALRSGPHLPSAPAGPDATSSQKVQRDETPAVSDPMKEATALRERIAELRDQGQQLPQELFDRLNVLVKAGFEKTFRDFDRAISNSGDKTMDLSAFAHQIRQEQNWPATGPILGHPGADEVGNFALCRIEALGGKVPVREATAMVALLGEDGIERHYMQERTKRGWPSMFANENALTWRDNPGFLERYLKQRHNNVLFNPLKRCVSRYDVYIARQIDDQERADFLQSVKVTLDPLFEGPDQVESSKAIELLQALFDLLERSPTLHDVAEIRETLRTAYRSTVQQLLLSCQNKPEAQAKLSELEQQRWSMTELTQDASVSYIFRIPDKADVTPAILSEPVSAVNLMIKFSGPEILNATRSEVARMMEESPEAHNYLRYHPQHLAALGLST